MPPHYLYGLARLEFLERFLFPVYAARVGNDAGFVLLVGHSGDGKTTTALKLIREQAFRLFSGNKTVIGFSQGTMTAVAGTRAVTEVTATGRRIFNLEKTEYETQTVVPIRCIVKLRLNDGAKTAKQLKPISALHTLYPFFLDAMNADVILGKGERVVPGNPSQAVREYLATELMKALEIVPTYTISGSLSYVLTTIQNI